MKKQLLYEMKKFFFQQRNYLILATVFIVSGLCALLLSQKGLAGIDIVDRSLAFFRPIGWLLCGYTMCDILGHDYHYKTMKNVLPHVSRNNYLFAKLLISGIVGIAFFILHLSATTVVAFALSLKWEAQWIGSFFIIALGVLAGVCCLLSFIIFSIIFFDNEAVAVGLSLGVVILQFILESIEPLSNYLPTLWPVVFPGLLRTNNSLIVWILAGAILFSFAFIFSTMRHFKKKDVFL